MAKSPAHSQQNHQRKQAGIHQCRCANGPWIGPAGHAIGSGNRSRSQFQSRKPGWKNSVADAFDEARPEGPFFNPDSKQSIVSFVPRVMHLLSGRRVCPALMLISHTTSFQPSKGCIVRIVSAWPGFVTPNS